MLPHLALRHVSHYRYDRAVALGPQLIRLRPAPHSRNRVLSYSLAIAPPEHAVSWQFDAFGNHQARVLFARRTTELKLTVDLLVDMTPYNPFDLRLAPGADRFPFQLAPASLPALAPYLASAPAAPRLQAWLARLGPHEGPILDLLVKLNQQLFHDIRYLVRLEPGVQLPEETLDQASGSCRDSGWLLVHLLRHLGLAARFVSGYLLESDRVDTHHLHAWCEVWLPGPGWIGLDPTSGLLAGAAHLPLACAPTPEAAAPVEGTVEPCQARFSHEISLRPVPP